MSKPRFETFVPASVHNAAVNELKEEIFALNEEIKGMENELAIAKDRVVICKYERRHALTQLDSCLASREDQAKIIRDLRESLSKMFCDRDSARAVASNYAMLVHNLRSDVHKAREETAAKHKAMEESKQRVAELESRINGLSNGRDALRTANAKFHDENKKLEKDLITARETIAMLRNSNEANRKDAQRWAKIRDFVELGECRAIRDKLVQPPSVMVDGRPAFEWKGTRFTWLERQSFTEAVDRL